MELYHLAEQYFHEHGDLLVPGDYVCYGKRLGRWIGTQRTAGKGKRGQLTESQIRRLEAIGMSWDPVEERWQAMYQLAKEYYDVHQMLNIPSNYVTDTGVRLGQWIARQRKCYKNYLAGKAGGGVQRTAAPRNGRTCKKYRGGRPSGRRPHQGAGNEGSPRADRLHRDGRGGEDRTRRYRIRGVRSVPRRRRRSGGRRRGACGAGRRGRASGEQKR